MVSTKTQIAGFEFDNCLMNAAGVACMTIEELEEVKNSAAGTFVTKTATLDFRQGILSHATKMFHLVPSTLWACQIMAQTIIWIIFRFAGKRVEPNFLLISGRHVSRGNPYYFEKVQESDFRGLTELNLSCPNVPGKPQIAYDFETTDRILAEVFAYFTKPLGIKLPPYFDIVHFDQAAAIFNKYPLKFVNCVNSIGNGLYIEDESVVIRPKNGFGGIGGEYIKPTALANVHAFYQRLNPQIQIIGTGGVLTGRDAFEHILCGASMVQVGTTLHKEGVSAFDRITNELKAIMVEKGYESLEDFRGKLRYID